MASTTCEMAEVNRDTGDMRQCGKPAKYLAFDPPVAFCEECCHLAMEDASTEEQATLKPIQE